MTVQAPTPLILSATQSTAPSNFDLEAAVLSATLERIGLYDSQIVDLMQKMKDRNSTAIACSLEPFAPTRYLPCTGATKK